MLKPRAHALSSTFGPYLDILGLAESTMERDVQDHGQDVDRASA